MSYGQKPIFNTEDARHLEFKKIHFWSCDCRRIRNLLMYTKFRMILR